MKIQVKAFGPIMDLLGRELTMDLPEGATIDTLAEQLQKGLMVHDNDDVSPNILHSNLTVLVNGRNVQTLRNRILKDGDFVAILSPFVGG